LGKLRRKEEGWFHLQAAQILHPQGLRGRQSRGAGARVDFGVGSGAQVGKVKSCGPGKLLGIQGRGGVMVTHKRI